MIQEKNDLQSKIRLAEHHINSHQKRIDYWLRLEKNLKNEYGTSPKEHERTHNCNRPFKWYVKKQGENYSI